ncbi:MAG: 1-deoxy-D-xylulose-5-phosphate synthase [Pseudohongiellaceae bacterium]|jgi:1-deoxy-D-xylulose-5-phosphate synthase
MLDEIPVIRPETPLLDEINSPADLKLLAIDQLEELAEELRLFLLYSVGQTGGHFGAGLGVVELTIALHYVFNTPTDRLVWDVGHQAYPHKILTGRRDEMLTMRQAGGLAAFPSRKESEYDTFGVGHSSTSISAALGMMIGSSMKQLDNYQIAVIGDGAMTAGMAFEALNHAGHLDDNLLVILNDNNMSISKNVGGLSSYFARMWASKPYNFIRKGTKKVLSTIPPVLKAAHRTEEYMKGMVSPGTLFEEIGFNYIGLVDGHDTAGLVEILSNIRTLRGPQLLHIVTQKGKGYIASEKDPFGMHALSKIETNTAKQSQQILKPSTPTYSKVFGDWLCQVAAADPLVVGITPAMGEGSGMKEFAEKYPERFHDVAIAEQHAVTFAAGMACEGLKPVVAIYSTFLQRAYDQLIHDVALQNLDVLFALDRAGLVGEDGPTHAGSFDVSYLRCIPNMLVMAPSDEDETYKLLSTGYAYQGPAAVRYPRGKGPGTAIQASLESVPIGKAVQRRKGNSVAILAFGSMVQAALAAGSELDATVVDMRFIKPIDEQLIGDMATSHQLIVTVEESVIMGGAGSAVNEFLLRENYLIPVLNLGLPDSFVEHGKVQQMLADVGLDAAGIAKSIRQKLLACKIRSKAV